MFALVAAGVFAQAENSGSGRRARPPRQETGVESAAEALPEGRAGDEALPGGRENRAHDKKNSARPRRMGHVRNRKPRPARISGTIKLYGKNNEQVGFVTEQGKEYTLRVMPARPRPELKSADIRKKDFPGRAKEEKKGGENSAEKLKKAPAENKRPGAGPSAHKALTVEELRALDGKAVEITAVKMMPRMRKNHPGAKKDPHGMTAPQKPLPPRDEKSARPEKDARPEREARPLAEERSLPAVKAKAPERRKAAPDAGKRPAPQKPLKDGLLMVLRVAEKNIKN